MSKNLKVEEMEDLKARFLISYRELKTPKEVLEFLGFARGRLNNWLQGDSKFRDEFNNIRMEIQEECDKLLMKHAGVMPWTKDDIKEGRRKWSNIRALELIKRANPGDLGSVLANNTNMSLIINGVSASDISGLTTPDPPPEEAKIIEAEVIKETPKTSGMGDLIKNEPK